MSVKIRLKRFGKIHAPQYRVVVADSRTKRDGRVIEEVGHYEPTREPSYIQVASDRVQYWLSQGAQPSEAVRRLLQLTGDWARFKGDENAESTVRPPEPKKVFERDANKKSVIRERVADSVSAEDADTGSGAESKTDAAEAPAE